MRKIGLAIAVAVIIAVSPFALAQTKSAPVIAEQVGQTQSNQPEKSVQTAFTNLMAAIEENNYDNFVAAGNAAFKEGITRQMFTRVSAELAPRMKKGYEAVFLGELRQQGYRVYLWKLTFKDGGDDLLAKLSLKDGKVGGFWLT